uniref:alanine racemase n=1 Tax=Blastomonas sp. TaxID=1909299 RepID=UPI003593EA73
FVAHWQEAAALADVIDPASIAVLHGIAPGEEGIAASLGAVPVLNSEAQVARWRAMGGGRCHVMIDTGMNRLGLRHDAPLGDLLAGLDIDICMSHLASADDTSTQNAAQQSRYVAVMREVRARRYSLANSAGVALGADYAFDLTRPGLALYGGVPCAALAGVIRPVMTLEARILQVRDVRAGETVGYGATFTAPADMRTATVALGYADGYKRALSGLGRFRHGDALLPVIGRVSMDLTCVDISRALDLHEGDWLHCDLDLAAAEAMTGISQYEWLTQIGHRFDRVWQD